MAEKCVCHINGYRVKDTEARKTAENAASIANKAVSVQEVPVELTGCGSGSSCTLLYFPGLGICLLRAAIQLTEEVIPNGIPANTNHNLLTIPAEYRSEFRTALTVSGTNAATCASLYRDTTTKQAYVILKSADDIAAGSTFYVSGVWRVVNPESVEYDPAAWEAAY